MSDRQRLGEEKITRTAKLCSVLKSDPSRVDYIELTLSVAGLVDDMIEDSDPGAEHT